MRDKFGRFMKGHKDVMTESHKKKISLALTGRKLSPKHIEIIRKNATGRKFTEEHKKHISNSLMGHKGYWKGKHHITEYSFKKGYTPWNKGTKGIMKAWNKGKPHLVKEKHPNWKGGITPEILKRCNSIKWKKIRKKVYKRDNYICQNCGKHCKKDISCHHIIPYHISKNHNLKNLITLCKKCHGKIEWGLLFLEGRKL